jgi:lipoprotein-releasing system permease protein
MKFESLVALRYLRSPNRPAILRLVTLLAVIGVTAGVTTLVIALSMDSGFRQAISDRLLSVTADVNLKPLSPNGIRDYQQLMAKLNSTPEVRSIEPAVYDEVLLSAGSGVHSQGIILKGVDPSLAVKTSGALRHIVSGSADFAVSPDGIPAILIGRLMAEDLNLSVGDYVTLISPQGNLTPFGMLPHPKRFRVTGIYDSGFYDYDANWAFATLKSAQALAGVGDVVSLLEVRIANKDDAPQVANDLLARAGPGFTATTWMQENRPLFHALSLEKLVTFIFIGLITFVAGLNILVVLMMTVTERARDIAVLMAMGTRRRQIRRIFLAQGLVVSVIGIVAGLVLGYGAAVILNTWKVIPLNPQVYAIPYVPFRANALDGLWIALTALAISIAASILPAQSAAKILPVNILRFE